jgi:two-component system, NarL family, sensor histidine kinase UhpB
VLEYCVLESSEGSMTPQRNILHVEDSPDDAELVRLALRPGAQTFRIERVDSEPEYCASLAARPDVILCDYDMPGFSAERALAILGEQSLDIPFIVVSNHIGQSAAVVAMQHGADDYLSKRDLGRLPKAIASAIERARERAERAQAQAALRASEAMKRGILDSLDSRIAVLDAQGVILAVNRAWEEFDNTRNSSGYRSAAVGENYFAVLRDAGAKGNRFAEKGEAAIRSVLERRAPFATLDYQLGSGPGARWHLARVMPLEGSDHGAVVSHQDITDRMMAHAAIENAHQRLQALSKRVLAIQEEERRSISRELHDDIGQDLAALKIGLHRLAQANGGAPSALLGDCLAVAETTLEKLRNIAQELRPPQLDQLGLVEAIAWLAERQRRTTGLEIVCEFSGLDEGRPPAALESACYRIAQEALNNATRHGSPKRIVVRVERDGGLLKLSVRDDGVGFDEEAQRLRALKSGSLGLISMEERAELAGGRLKLRSVVGGGTTVSVLFPVGEGEGG